MGTVEMEADWLRIVSCQSQGTWGSLCSSLYGPTHLDILVLEVTSLYSGLQEQLAGKHRRRFELSHVNLLLQFKTEIWPASVLPQTEKFMNWEEIMP